MRAKQHSLFRAPPPVLRPSLVRTDSGVLVIVIPGLKLVSEANAHEHWRVRAKRAKSQRATAAMLLRSLVGQPPALPLDITITRTSAGCLDSDNLQGSAKHVRDGIADWIGVDDGNPGYTWRVEQSRGARGAVAVTIRIAPRGHQTSLPDFETWKQVLG